jgi:hypothetical protein
MRRVSRVYGIVARSQVNLRSDPPQNYFVSALMPAQSEKHPELCLEVAKRPI